MTLFLAEESVEDSIAVLTVEGYLDAFTAHQLESEIERLRDRGRCRIVVDCAQVDYISSRGLVALLEQAEQLRKLSGDIHIACPSDRLRELLEALRLHEAFGIFATIEEAKSRFQPLPSA